MAQPERLTRELIYDCPWFTLYGDRVRFPGGWVAERYHVVDMAQQAACALVDDGDGHVLLVKTYRYPIGAVQWETPAGGIEPGESPEQAALRETREESGHACCAARTVYTYYPLSGLTTSVFHIVRARATGLVGAFDENEVAEWRWFSRAEIEALLAAGELRDGYSLTALLLWLREEQGA